MQVENKEKETRMAHIQITDANEVENGRFADTYNCIKTAFHDTNIFVAARMSVSWNAVFMQLYVSAKRPHPHATKLIVYMASACTLYRHMPLILKPRSSQTTRIALGYVSYKKTYKTYVNNISLHF